MSCCTQQAPLSAEDRKLALLAALLLPLRAAVAVPEGGTKKQKAAAGSAARHIVRCATILPETRQQSTQARSLHVFLLRCKSEARNLL